MSGPSQIEDVPGGSELVGWFGAVPSFHDAEVLSFDLERDKASKLVIYGFRMTSEIDEQGYYVLDRKFIATFELDGIDKLELEGFSSQNILGTLSVAIRPAGAGFDLELDAIYGLAGRVGCKRLHVSFAPQ
ncbi:Imm50 family immunity protein [Mesorhizobium australicum]|uniref:Immunity protein 50 n=1 Tax=Mesorhizobium australicum TaxID=536018 RepID=A0A1X7Q0F9_9HYPH|nr:Imm50 family immunity protein [Mesorhizobium australicum]SMH57414.1 Immunity protein 50 [Mesorhizobium australicum]